MKHAPAASPLPPEPENGKRAPIVVLASKKGSAPAPAGPVRYRLSAPGLAGTPAGRARGLGRLRGLRHLLGVRLQLTFWYTGIFGLLLLLAGVLVYANLENSLAGSPDSALRLRAQQLADGVNLEKNQIVTHGEISDLPGFDPLDNHLTSPADVNFDNLVRLLDMHGQVLYETPAFKKVHVPQESITQPLQGTPWQGTVHVRDD